MAKRSAKGHSGGVDRDISTNDGAECNRAVAKTGTLDRRIRDGHRPDASGRSGGPHLDVRAEIGRGQGVALPGCTGDGAVVAVPLESVAVSHPPLVEHAREGVTDEEVSAGRAECAEDIYRVIGDVANCRPSNGDRRSRGRHTRDSDHDAVVGKALARDEVRLANATDGAADELGVIARETLVGPGQTEVLSLKAQHPHTGRRRHTQAARGRAVVYVVESRERGVAPGKVAKLNKVVGALWVFDYHRAEPGVRTDRAERVGGGAPRSKHVGASRPQAGANSLGARERTTRRVRHAITHDVDSVAVRVLGTAAAIEVRSRGAGAVEPVGMAQRQVVAEFVRKRSELCG